MLALFRKSRRLQDMKNRILKNREGVLAAMAENMSGARTCPLLLGQKCIGPLCEFFVKYDELKRDGTVRSYHRCVFVQAVSMQIEGNDLLRVLVDKLDVLTVRINDSKKVPTDEKHFSDIST